MEIHEPGFTDNTVGFRIEEKLTEQRVQAIFDRINDAADQHGKVRLYFEVPSFKGFDSLRTIFQVAKGKMEVLNKMEKFALVTSMEWIRQLGGFGDFITPGIDVRMFRPEEKEAALGWLEFPTVEDTVSITRLADLPDHVIGILVDGKLGRSDAEYINALFESQLERQEKLQLFLEVEELEGMTARGFWEDLKTGFKYASKTEKMAVVGGDWLKPLVQIGDLITPGVDVRYFSTDLREAAQSWISK